MFQPIRWSALLGIFCCLVLAGCEDDRSSNRPPEALARGSQPAPAQAGYPAGSPAARYCALIALNPDREKDYRKLIKEVPRPVRDSMQKHGIRNCSVYLCATSEQIYAIRYYEYAGLSHDEDMADLDREPEFKKWRNSCEECEFTLLPLKSERWWAFGQEILHWNNQPAPSQAKYPAGSQAARYCALIALNPDREKDYRNLTKEVPRPVRDSMQKHGIRNHSVYLCTTNEQIYAIRYYEYTGLFHDEDMADLDREPEFKTWRDSCGECEVALLPLKSERSWASGQEVLHLD